MPKNLAHELQCPEGEGSSRQSMKSEILWINHAGYELRAGGLRIVHDPWLSGLAFGNGWALLSESKYLPEDFLGVDYIWLSHEHPDHFSPAAMKAIPEEARKSITVLYQRTRDKRVVRFCDKLGFNTRELENKVRTPLNEYVAVTCGTVHSDSWLFTETPDFSIFNANDCVGIEWHKVAAALSRPTDILMTQFSYANWVGNPGEHDRMKAVAARKILEMKDQIAAFKPRTLIPFASYVWFCRDDNFHMNAHANRIGEIAKIFSETVKIAILYPGEIFSPNVEHDNLSSIARYDVDTNSHKTPLTIVDESVTLEALTELALAAQRRLRKMNAMFLLKPLEWLGLPRPVGIYLSDIKEGIFYSMFGGILNAKLRREDCDISFSTASFAAMLKNGYGYATLAVNGRYIELAPGSASKLSRHFAIAAQNEEGFSIAGMLFRREYIFAKFARILGLNS